MSASGTATSSGFAGKCLCGSVTYRCNAEPMMVTNCHCEDCQRVTGTAYACVAGVARDCVMVQGDVKQYSGIGESGKSVTRSFCPECGSSLYSVADALPGWCFIMLGTADDKSWIKPNIDCYTRSAFPSVLLQENTRKFEGAVRM